MERKEHPVATISGGGKVLKLLDPDGNPYTPPEPVDYQLLDGDGEVLKEGTIKDTDEIPLDDVSSTSFRVMIDSHLVLDTKGFESPVEDEDQKIIDGPTFDPDEGSDLDEFLTSKENQKESEEENSGTGDDSGNDNEDEKNEGDDASQEDDDTSDGGDDDQKSGDEGSKDSEDQSSDPDEEDNIDSNSDDSKDSDDQDNNNKEPDESEESGDKDSDDADEESTDLDDK